MKSSCLHMKAVKTQPDKPILLFLLDHCDLLIGNSTMYFANDTFRYKYSHLKSTYRSLDGSVPGPFVFTKIHHLSRGTLESPSIVVCVFVKSRIDCSNSLAYVTSDYNIHSLQPIQTSSVLAVTNILKYDRISAILENLH